ncbi:MAG: hypothetical protein ABL888_02410 [Pirellulaceae bacterium]
MDKPVFLHCHSTILIDEAHNNFHTSPNHFLFCSLSPYDILVISNALGNLLLFADHPLFGAAGNRLTIDAVNHHPDGPSSAAKMDCWEPITEGRCEDEKSVRIKVEASSHHVLFEVNFIPPTRAEGRQMIHRELELPFTTSPSGSCLVLHVQEQGPEYLDLTGWFRPANRYARIRFTFKRFLGGRIVGMGGEAGEGIGVVEDSLWLEEYNREQREHYPTFADNFSNVKHYYFRSHDVNVEVLAEDIQWETLQELPNW